MKNSDVITPIQMIIGKHHPDYIFFLIRTSGASRIVRLIHKWNLIRDLPDLEKQWAAE